MNYLIKRIGGKVVLAVDKTEGDFVAITPERSRQVWDHSPDGFEFGYGGSGPSQLALAILLDYTDNPVLAQKYYQDFKWEFIATIRNPFDVITEEQIKNWMEKQNG